MPVAPTPMPRAWRKSGLESTTPANKSHNLKLAVYYRQHCNNENCGTVRFRRSNIAESLGSYLTPHPGV